MLKPDRVYEKNSGVAADLRVAAQQARDGLWVAEGGGIRAGGTSHDDAAAHWVRLVTARIESDGPFPIEVLSLFSRGSIARRFVVATTVGQHARWEATPGLLEDITHAAAAPGATLAALLERFADGELVAGAWVPEVTVLG